MNNCPSQHRSTVCLALAVSALLWAQAFAEEQSADVALHPIEQGLPRDVVLKRDASIWEAVVNWFKDPPGFWDMTVHQYATKTGVSRTSFRAATTGRSLTLRVEKDVVVGSFSHQSGDRIEIMARLFLEHGKLVASSSTTSREDQVIVNLSSSGLGPIDHDLSKANPIYWVTADSLAEAKRGGRRAGRFGVAGYGGGRHCGWETFYDGNFAEAHHRQGPFARGNLFVKMLPDESLVVASCDNRSAPAYCKAASSLAGWAPFEVNFYDKHLCQADQVLQAGQDWLQRRIIREKHPAESINGDR